MSYKRREMSADRKRNLSPFGEHKKRIPPSKKKQRTVMAKENRQNFADTDRGSYYQGRI